MKRGGTIGHHLDRWLDECKMALSGVVLATRERQFLLTFAISFVIFGTIMNLLSGSTAALNLFWASDLGGKLKIIGDTFLANFGIGRELGDWLFTFVITILQSILIGLVVMVWHKRRQARREQKNMKEDKADSNSSNLQDAGLVAGLAILGSGCPSCGTTLLAPIISTIFSSGGYALAGTISGVLNVAAVLLALFALKRVGKDAFVLITSEHYQKRHKKEEKHAG